MNTTEKPNYKKKIEAHFARLGYLTEDLEKLDLWKHGNHIDRLYLWAYFDYLTFKNNEEYYLFTVAVMDVIQPFFRDIIDFKDEKAIKHLELTSGIKINKLPSEFTSQS